MSNNQAKINDFGATGVPKSTQMVTRSGPKVILETNQFQGGDFGAPCGDLFLHFGATWPILADFWDPSKSDRAPKTVQKNQYGYFLVPLGDQRAEKIGFGRRLERTWKFDQKSRRKWEAAKVENH